MRNTDPTKHIGSEAMCSCRENSSWFL